MKSTEEVFETALKEMKRERIAYKKATGKRPTTLRMIMLYLRLNLTK